MKVGNDYGPHGASKADWQRAHDTLTEYSRLGKMLQAAQHVIVEVQWRPRSIKTSQQAHKKTNAKPLCLRTSLALFATTKVARWSLASPRLFGPLGDPCCAQNTKLGFS